MTKNELYFYTSTIRNWKPILREFDLQPIIIDSLQFLTDRDLIKVYGFVIMPNHMHLIWEALQDNRRESPAASLMKFTAHEFEKRLKSSAPSILKNFAVEMTDRDYNFWQKRPDEFLLLKEHTISQKLDYMHFNPTQEHWKLAKEPEDYYYSSASYYCTGVKNFNFLFDYRDWEERSYSH